MSNHDLLIEIEDELGQVDSCIDRLQFAIEKLRRTANSGTLNKLEDSLRDMYDQYLDCSQAVDTLINEWIEEN